MPSTLCIQLQLRIVSDDDTVIRDEVILQLDKSDARLEAVGLCLKDSEDLLGRLQHAVVEAQAATYVNRYRCCSTCGRRLCGKGQYPIVFRTAFGHVPLASPRFYRCRCHPADSRTFSPLAELFTEHTAPELLYLESRWASLISFGMTTALLKDVLPVAGTTNPETVRQHLHRVAARQDTDLGTGEPGLRDDEPAADQPSPIPREAVIAGIDGGYLRNWHDKGNTTRGRSSRSSSASRWPRIAMTATWSAARMPPLSTGSAGYCGARGCRWISRSQCWRRQRPRARQ